MDDQQAYFQDVEKYRGLPEIAMQIVSFLDYFVTKKMRVFEWGSGGSTLFFSRRAAHVISIEHSKEWFAVVSKALEYIGVNGSCDHKLVSWDMLLSLDGDEYQSSQPNLKGKTFKNYVTAIDEYDDSSFDLIFIDGRARAACIKRSAPKLKPGGAMVVDNTEREQYASAMEVLRQSGWDRIDAVGPAPYLPLQQMVATSVLLKPLEQTS
jgi:precorrin-6B methylase 2